MYSKWFNEYNKLHSDVQINYQSIGSGGGIRQVLNGTVDFGASDGPMTDDQLKEAKVQDPPHSHRAGRGRSRLQHPRRQRGNQVHARGVLADIFLGKITNWNDPAIAKANPGMKFPDQPIIVVHRSDGSGTTYIFTDYLSKVSKDWESIVGKGTSVKWPGVWAAKATRASPDRFASCRARSATSN